MHVNRLLESVVEETKFPGRPVNEIVPLKEYGAKLLFVLNLLEIVLESRDILGTSLIVQVEILYELQDLDSPFPVIPSLSNLVQSVSSVGSRS